MAAAIKEKTGIDTRLVVGARGAFEVLVDGKLVFSKLAEDRFPEPAEILATV